MKWTRSEILKKSGNITVDEDVMIDSDVFQDNLRINSVRDVHVTGRGYLDEENDQFYCNLEVEGVMLIPDAITNEEIEYPFDTVTDEVYSFDDTDDEEVRIVSNDDVIDLLPAVIEAILLEVPIEMSEASEDEYPEGEGWKVYSEEGYEKSREEDIDPRLAILKNYKNEDKN